MTIEGIKMDVVPGETTHIYFDRPDYTTVCLHLRWFMYHSVKVERERLNGDPEILLDESFRNYKQALECFGKLCEEEVTPTPTNITPDKLPCECVFCGFDSDQLEDMDEEERCGEFVPGSTYNAHCAKYYDPEKDERIDEDAGKGVVEVKDDEVVCVHCCVSAFSGW